MKANDFDCIVVGAGHAGVEAAHAAARIGVKTALITISRDTISKMSCNPAIGGLAKGQITREVDALGGLMGLAADATGIQFRLLNRSKGPAVQSPRAQVDKYQYSKWMCRALEDTDNLTIVENIVVGIKTSGRAVQSVVCKDGSVYRAKTVIVATGTFLRGLMHVGSQTFEGGRLGEPASCELSDALKNLGLRLGRLKTGTPPRLDASTVDFDRLEVQCGDKSPFGFSFLTDRIDRQQIPCWITYTNEKIHKLIRDNLGRAPLYTGQIKSIGPRYCPSIEIKVVRYADKKCHQVFLEPEESQVRVIYCNGISTSLPEDIQEQILKMLPGTENARIVHYAYAIEYDYCPPIQLTSSLETRNISGLFLAGQINGTSGYEEAAGQGIIAGINAALKLQSKEPIVLGRDRAYIGVLIDDLLTKDIDEPYRMFTSRAEFRLCLRSDNADRRLTRIGRLVGLVGQDRWDRYQKKLRNIEKLTEYLKGIHTDGISLWGHLRRPNSVFADKLAEEPFVKVGNFSQEELHAVIIDAKYEGYLEKQERLADSFRSLENKRIPQGLDVGNVMHLRLEAREKLEKFRPSTLAQAARISGITPADITVLQIHLKKYYGHGF